MSARRRIVGPSELGELIAGLPERDDLPGAVILFWRSGNGEDVVQVTWILADRRVEVTCRMGRRTALATQDGSDYRGHAIRRNLVEHLRRALDWLKPSKRGEVEF